MKSRHSSHILNYEKTGKGKYIVLIHGIMGSSRYWNNMAKQLAKSFCVISIDLLGFGESPKPKNSSYNYTAHTDAILATLNFIGLESDVMIIGHSMGGLIGLKLAVKNPERFKKVMMINPPVFFDPEDARTQLTKYSRSYRMIQNALYGQAASFLLTSMKPFFSMLLPYFLTYLPKEVAGHVPYHTWASMMFSIQNIIEKQNLLSDIKKAEGKVVLAILRGNDDELASLRKVAVLLEASSKISVYSIPGKHQLPIENEKEVLDLVYLFANQAESQYF